jgi:beta-glucuronidase
MNGPWSWVNEKKVCQLEGGITSFNRDVTPVAHAEDNFVVAAAVNTWRDDGVPGLKTDWWNQGGLTKACSLHEVVDTFIDQARTSKAGYLLSMSSRAQR